MVSAIAEVGNFLRVSFPPAPSIFGALLAVGFIVAAAIAWVGFTPLPILLGIPLPVFLPRISPMIRVLLAPTPLAFRFERLAFLASALVIDVAA